MSEAWVKARHDVFAVCRRIHEAGLVSGANGNVSVRVERGLLAITPSRVPWARLQPEEVVIADYEGEPVDGKGIPSSETMMHVAVYRARPDAGSVIHAHSPWAMVLAVAGLDIPPLIDEQVVYLGGVVRVAAYALPASEELGRNALAALGDRRAALLRNHGVLVVGQTPDDAAAVCEQVERLAKTYVYARLLGNVNFLPEEALEAELSIYKMAQMTQLTKEMR